MKISKLHIKNLRSFKDQVIDFDDYTCLIGPNGSGKSTVLFALNIFFRNNATASAPVAELTKEDFHGCDTSQPIEIKVTFTELSPQAQDDFKAYFRAGELAVCTVAKFDPHTEKAPAEQHGIRKGMKAFAQFFAKMGDGELVSTLKDVYSKLKASIPALPDWKNKEEAKKALWDYEANNANKCEDILSKDAFYGFTKGKNLLEKHIQWVYIPAVHNASKDAAEQKESALSALLKRTVRAKINFEDDLDKLRKNAKEEYDKLVESRQADLDEISNSLGERIKQWAHPGADCSLQWNIEDAGLVKIDGPSAKVEAGEDGFKGELIRLGHGLQRSYIFSLLQIIAETPINSGATGTDPTPTLLLGIEEPELYQHPSQIRHLSQELNKLSQNGAQVILCSHSPHFVSAQTYKDVRLFSKDGSGRAKIKTAKIKDIKDKLNSVGYNTGTSSIGTIAKLENALHPETNELFFARRLVLVEGAEDVAYIACQLVLSEKWDGFRAKGGCIIPVGGKSRLIQPIVIAQALEIPVFVMFDLDSDVTNHSHKEIHKKDNAALFILLGKLADPFSNEIMIEKRFAAWPKNISTDIGEDIKKIYTTEWEGIGNEVRAELGHPGNLDKNPIFIAKVMEKLWGKGIKSEDLQKVVGAICDFCGI